MGVKRKMATRSSTVSGSLKALIVTTILVAMLLNMGLLVPVPSALAEPEGCCWQSASAEMVEPEELNGAAKHKAISEVLSSDIVKEYIKDLIALGFTPKVDEAAAVIFRTEHGDLISVAIPLYEKGKSDIEAVVGGISIVKDGYSAVVGAISVVEDEIVAFIDPGWLECIIGSIICGAAIGAVIGCAIVTMGVGLIACLATVFGISAGGIAAAIAAGVGVVWGCVVACCCMGYGPCCDLL